MHVLYVTSSVTAAEHLAGSKVLRKTKLVHRYDEDESGDIIFGLAVSLIEFSKGDTSVVPPPAPAFK
jgi:hypothetical protein